MEHIDKIYYINIDHRTDRKEQFLQWVRDTGIPEEKVERIQAVYIPDRPHLGCILSHIKALGTFLNSTNKNCIVFEDDFVPIDTSTFWSNFNNLFASGVPFDVVTCSYNQEKLGDSPENAVFLKKLLSTFTTSSYLTTREYARVLYQNYKEAFYLAQTEEMITHKKTHRFSLDVYWCNLMPEARWFCFYPRIGKQSESFSDIERCVTNHNV